MVNHEAVLRQLGAAEAGGAGGDREGQHERLLATVVGQEPTKPRAISVVEQPALSAGPTNGPCQAREAAGLPATRAEEDPEGARGGIFAVIAQRQDDRSLADRLSVEP